MSNYDITLQTETAKRHINLPFAIAFQDCFYPRCGEEFWKAELDFLLGRYDNIAFKRIIKNMVKVQQSFIKQSAIKFHVFTTQKV
jgi:hypothetical protein